MKKVIIAGLLLVILIVGGAVALMPSAKMNSNADVLALVSPFTDLSPQQFKQALVSTRYTLIDVRTVAEYGAGHLAKAEQSDYYQTQQFSKFLDSLDKNKSYLIYCRTGVRSGEAMDLMLQKGFKSVYDLAGGYNAWVAAGYPTVQ